MELSVLRSPCHQKHQVCRIVDKAHHNHLTDALSKCTVALTGHMNHMIHFGVWVDQIYRAGEALKDNTHTIET